APRSVRGGDQRGRHRHRHEPRARGGRRLRVRAAAVGTAGRWSPGGCRARTGAAPPGTARRTEEPGGVRPRIVGRTPLVSKGPPTGPPAIVTTPRSESRSHEEGPTRTLPGGPRGRHPARGAAA